MTLLRAADVQLSFGSRTVFQGLTLTMGLLGALAAGIAGAFGIEAMRATVHSRRDGELRLGLPILGVLPERA